jgi:hypothetical protein
MATLCDHHPIKDARHAVATSTETQPNVASRNGHSTISMCRAELGSDDAATRDRAVLKVEPTPVQCGFSNSNAPLAMT